MEGNSIKTFQNLCKIFEMKIKLDRAKGVSPSQEIEENYEKYASKIDAFYNEEFQKELKTLISPRNTLEEEKERLDKLISLLEARLEKRSSLAEEFHETTGKYIKNLQLIVSESELKNKKERLSLITKYLDTTKEIENITETIKKLKEDLSLEETKKDGYDDKNKVLEDELYSVFVTNINNDDYYREIEEEKIIDILDEVTLKSNETKETLDITNESVSSLLSSGMNDEYESYIEEARKNYYLWKEREIILKIYKLVIDFKEEFSELLNKRKLINELLEERNKIIPQTTNILLTFENEMLEQSKTLNNEKEILDNISNLKSRIDFKENRLEELKKVVEEPEILVILNEYHILDTYDNNVEEMPIFEDDIIPKIDEPNNIEVIEHNPYTIISVEDAPITLNIGLAKLKGESVRDKVNKKLNPEIINTNEDNNISTKENTIPVFDDSINEKHEEEINIVPEKTLYNIPTPQENNLNNATSVESQNDGNIFWVPVSDSKLEASEFPNINIPVENNNLNLGEDNFGFPETNN